jgi:hypothetical protein
MPQPFDRHGLDYLQSNDYHSAITGLCSIFCPTRHVKNLHFHTLSESIKSLQVQEWKECSMDLGCTFMVIIRLCTVD